MTKKKILFIVDIRGWAYDDAALNWKKRMSAKYDIDILYLDDYETLKYSKNFNKVLKTIQSDISLGKASSKALLTNKEYFVNSNNKKTKIVFDHNIYDGIVFFYHRALCDSRLLGTPIPMNKVAICINNEKWIDEGSKDTYNNYLSGAKILVGCNSFILKEFRRYHKKIIRASQCIDQTVFYKNRDRLIYNRDKETFLVGWSGNYGNKIKNFDKIRTACKVAGVKLSAVKNLNRTELNDWYNKVDVVICASKAEGGPLMLLEAGACNVPVITTEVGLAREIIKHESNGLFIEPSVQSIAKAINRMYEKPDERRLFSTRLNKAILKNWTYDARVGEVEKLLEMLCQN
jgi:glycosyltransferase involved in cell wall biosynthesis